MTNEEGVWLYAITDNTAKGWQPQLRGVDGETVRKVEAAGLTAMVGTVALARFGEAALKSNLEDLDWLAETARTHDAVVTSIVEQATTAPVRLATVYMDDTRIEKLLIDDQNTLRQTLNRLTGRTEWGVKGYAAPAKAPPPSEPSTPQGSGAAYLRRRRDQLSARQNSEQQAFRQAGAVHEALAAIGAETRLHPPQDPRLTGAKSTMVFNGAYLVPDERRDYFASAVSALSNDTSGIQLELTGPWPPYSFTGIEGNRL